MRARKVEERRTHGHGGALRCESSAVREEEVLVALPEEGIGGGKEAFLRVQPRARGVGKERKGEGRGVSRNGRILDRVGGVGASSLKRGTVKFRWVFFFYPLEAWAAVLDRTQLILGRPKEAKKP